MEHAYLSEVLPGYKNTLHDLANMPHISPIMYQRIRNHLPANSSSQEPCSSNPPEYNTNENKFMDLVPGQKLRIVNGALEIDTRKFQSIYRKYTKDSRYTILEKIFEEFPRYLMWFDLLRTEYKPDARIMRSWGKEGLVSIAYPKE